MLWDGWGRSRKVKRKDAANDGRDGQEWLKWI